MTGTSSSSARTDKIGKEKSLLVATVKDEFASPPARNRMFGKEGNLTIEHEILKENHETLKRDYESLQERIKQEEETFEIMKKLQRNSEELQVTNARLLEDIERERSEKEKYKKMFEKLKAMESERKATTDEVRMNEHELLMARGRQKEDLEMMENKFVELAEKFGVVEKGCSYLKSLYDAEVAASGGETENLTGLGGNDVNNNVTDSVNDESDDEQDNPPKEGNVTTQRSVERSQEEQCKNRANSSNVSQALGETDTERAVNHPLPFPTSPSSSSSSSSSLDGYDVVVKLPANWPEWAIPEGPEDDSNKS